jgi:long-chain acyl-CoA synthetase
MSNNRIEWAITDYATQAIGAVLVPLYPSLLENQVKYILDDSEARVVIVSDELLFHKVKNVQSSLLFTKNFYVMDSEEISLPAAWKSFEDLAKSGETFLKDNSDYNIVFQNDIGGSIYYGSDSDNNSIYFN